ncbi:Hsp20/alpha crystallin family protein [Brevibacterium casei]|uniref:18 kDa antigen 2 n=3 Tax=Brevibacterium casei TaxID=33889 RepID=K9AUF6_9MICO|nr:Hsp20/alpha crystallin family protein [Brevibacterium casei]EKU49706.1 18 kDa antigen 2 [Brevibacterium casei S18]MBE4693795.1 Hsp20/alpha crystallin family protein [Brevibacterium casei]MBY3576918.1 Hsp20/alpha crystallin family protein [Brevibacterium casei]MCT1448076.1 Hsp20/alpha crystallin family protein [Brevibacterium casei]MCT1552121.1 Hsp20/alpha crystallin family protein [Brevibacterium casei]
MATRFDPIRDLDRFFTEVTRNPNATTLPMDLYRDGEVFIAAIDMPGVEPSSIDVDVEDRTLTVRAQRTSPVGDKDVKWLTRERTTGTYARQLTLGNRVALDRIRADYEDGVLTLTIPVAEEARPRKISVQHQAPKQTEVVESTEVIETDDEQRL